MKVTQGQYPVPQEEKKRFKHARHKIWAGAICLFVFGTATTHVLLFSEGAEGKIAMIVLTILTLALLAWALVWYFRRAHFSYEAGPVRVTFVGPEYYVPWELMSRVVSCVIDAWRPVLGHEAESVFEGIQVMVTKYRPVDPAGRTDQAIGLTSHSRRSTQIWGPYVIHEAGLCYELALYGAEAVWPGLPEDLKIERMKNRGVLGRIQKYYRERVEVTHEDIAV